MKSITEFVDLANNEFDEMDIDNPRERARIFSTCISVIPYVTAKLVAMRMRERKKKKEERAIKEKERIVKEQNQLNDEFDHYRNLVLYNRTMEFSKERAR